MVIKFCFKNELTATETFKMLQNVYDNECLPRTNVFEWHGKFRSGRKSVDMIRGWVAPEPVEHRNKLQKYTLLLWQMIDVQ